MTDTVTRKNQGAEELEKPLERTIGKVLEDAGKPPGGYSVDVSCDLLDISLPNYTTRSNQSRPHPDGCGLSFPFRGLVIGANHNPTWMKNEQKEEDQSNNAYSG